MAKLNGSIYLSKRQVKMIAKGKKVRIWREGKAIMLSLKNEKTAAYRKIMGSIRVLREKLKALKAQETTVKA